MRNVKLIGVGGIGTALLPFLARHLAFAEDRDVRLTLIDGDEFVDRNAIRQAFDKIGNKAQVKMREIARQFENLNVRAVGEFVTPDNVSDLICEGDTILLAVDNHETRRLVCTRCATLPTVTLISGGNELIDGNVQVYMRKDGVAFNQSPLDTHAEIAHASGKTPGELSCEERAMQPESRQILVTNMGIACLMLIALWHVEQGNTKLGEFFLDIKQGKMVHRERPVQKENV